MRAEHNDLILIYLWSKIDKLDKVHKEAKKYAVDGKTTCRDFIDGLEEEKLLKDKEADAAFASFSICTMSEI